MYMYMICCVCVCVCVCGSDLQGHLENVEEHISRQKQALREASAKHQVSIIITLFTVHTMHTCMIINQGVHVSQTAEGMSNYTYM